MFPDSTLANLGLFVAAQLVVWAYLGSGLVVRGVVLLVASWVLGDVALVSRFVFGETGWPYVASLLGMQGLTLFEVVRLAHGQWQRRSPRRQAERERSFRAASVAFMCDDIAGAERGFARLVRRDPWELRARLALARIRVLQQRPSSARRLLIAARRLDRDGDFRDWIDLELGALARGHGARARAVEAAPPPPDEGPAEAAAEPAATELSGPVSHGG
ncbi:MAG: hypothetical protein IPM29_25590 [Planctomycetes bacterium]|nr:hypothetical protein [Planctomycetota bacterium]